VIDKFRGERLDAARVRASALVSLMDALVGVDVGVEDIQRADLFQLSPAGVQATLNVAYMALMQMDTLAAILAGACSGRDVRQCRLADGERAQGPALAALPPFRAHGR
jgi:hypothetical protein